MTEPVEVKIVQTEDEARELDELLWQTLWQPFGFPRDVRHSFMIQGEKRRTRRRGQSRCAARLASDVSK